MKLNQALLIGFMKEVDRNRDDYINLNEFKAAVGWEGDDDMNGMPALNNMALLPLMPYDTTTDFPQAQLEAIKVKVKN